MACTLQLVYDEQYLTPYFSDAPNKVLMNTSLTKWYTHINGVRYEGVGCFWSLNCLFVQFVHQVRCTTLRNSNQNIYDMSMLGRYEVETY